MLKNEITNNILNEMYPFLNPDEFTRLKNVIIRTLYGYEIRSECTEVQVIENDNEKYLKKFATYLKIENKAEGTIYRYVNSAKALLEFVGKNFRDITADDVAYYLANLELKTGVCANTIDNTSKYSKSFFSWLFFN